MTKQRRIVIVGGVAGGMSAATRLRRLDERAEITVLERSGYVSFANCGLPYHLSGTISERSSLLLQNPVSLKERFNIDVHVKTEALSVDREQQKVRAKNLLTGEETTFSYDYLVLSPGAAPVTPNVPGANRVMPMRDIEDMDRAVAWLGSKPTTAVVLGGGFIGLEVAENLVKRGVQVALIQRGMQLMSGFDPEMAYPILVRVQNAGVDVRLGTTVTAIGKKELTLSNGEVMPADLVFGALGVVPDVSLATSAELATGPHGGILVNEFHQTSDPRIYAVGDAVEKLDSVSSEPRLIPLAGLANRHGQAVAGHIVNGATRKAVKALGTNVLSFDGMTAAAVGWNEKQLRAQQRDIRIVHTHPAHHAGYYPGAQTMRLKLLVDAQTDQILGAQGVGGDGVDKRIDVIATAMYASLSASELADLELAYDPQHGSAKDPINMLGYINRNIVEGVTSTIEWHELLELQTRGAHLIDVRTAAEFERGHIPHALNFPLDELRLRHKEIPAGDLIVYCQVGQRGHTSARLLSQLGFQVKNLDGGYLTWRAGISSQNAP